MVDSMIYIMLIYREIGGIKLKGSRPSFCLK